MRLRVSVKLAAAVMLLVLTIAGAIALALHALSVERVRLETLLGRPVEQSRMAQEAMLELKALALAAQSMIVIPSDAGKQAAIADANAELVALRASLQRLRALTPAADAPELDRFAAALQSYSGLFERMAGLARLNSRSHALALSDGASAAAFDQLDAALRAMITAATARAKAHDALAPQIALAAQRLLTEINHFYRLEKQIVAETDIPRLDALGDSADKAADAVTAIVDDLSSYTFSRLAPDGMTEQMSTISDGFDRWVEVNKEIRRLARENGDGQAAALAATTGKALLAQADEAGNALVARSAATMRTELDRARTGYLANRNALLGIAIGGSLLSLAVVLAIVQAQVAGPLRHLGRAMAGIAAGEDVAVPGLTRSDEIGDMARSLQVFRREMVAAEELRAREETAKHSVEAERQATLQALAGRFESGIGEVAESVGLEAERMARAAGEMSAAAETAEQEAQTVQGAATQASGNVQLVAAAAEELAASIGEIGTRIHETARATGSAVDEARRSEAEMRALHDAAQEIGQVVSLVNEIAARTNLLALNATIEAARAGEAGRGFAVVAGEVKTLAGQTARATEQIGAQVAAIQQRTDRAVAAIRAVGGRIGGMDEAAAAIAAAIEQQAATTREIARNVEQAARGTTAVSDAMAALHGATRRAGSAVTQVKGGAEALTGTAGNLRIQAAEFLRHLGAGEARTG